MSKNFTFGDNHSIANLDHVTARAMARIEKNQNVIGILFIRNKKIETCTVPVASAQALVTQLPVLNAAMMHALSELDITDELMTYRVGTKSVEILVAANEDFTACVTQRLSRRKHKTMKILSNLLKDAQDEWLVKTTALINKINPMIDRVMEDESVEGVIMTNKEGAAILTNISSTRATNYGLSLHQIAKLAQMYIKELDTADEVLVTRINTKKIEIMVAPHPEFNIILIQNASHKVKIKKLKTKAV